MTHLQREPGKYKESLTPVKQKKKAATIACQTPPRHPADARPRETDRLTNALPLNITTSHM